MSLAYPSYWGSDGEPCRWVEVSVRCGSSSPGACGKPLRIRSSIRVPRFARMVGPGKMPLYPATGVDSPGRIWARPSRSVRAKWSTGLAGSPPSYVVA